MSTDFWLSRDEVRELDRRAIEEYGVPGVVLMENAGRGCAELLMRLNPERSPTVILCGPGNNGGDGFVIARHLDNHGWPIHLWVFANEPRPDDLGAAAVNYRIAKRLGVPTRFVPPDGMAYGGEEAGMRLAYEDLTGLWVVDAMFGTGLNRSMGQHFSLVEAELHASCASVLAVDIPSGLDCDTGEPLGPTVRATHTATFVAPKKGFLNPTAREWTGEVHVIDIGAPRKLVDEYRRTGERGA